MRILLVDDHQYNRELLRFILEDEGYECVQAANGEQAVAKFIEDVEVDLILMDVNMPEMDGISATKKIVELKGQRYINIIFVTALDDANVLVQCLDAGGDDFVPKPVNERVLLSKVKAHERNQSTYNDLLAVHEELQFHHVTIQRDHKIVEHVFTHGIDRAATYCGNVKSYSSPMSMFNGDLVLSAPSPSGGVYVLLGDFTGHGLSAAVGSLPVTGVFHSYVTRQASISEMAAEINRQLNELLPLGMFCCASLLYLDETGRELSLWSGGMNATLVINPDGQIKSIPACHLPLGVASPDEFDDSLQLHRFEQGTYIVLFSDGVNEAKNADDEEFGEQRILSLLASAGDSPVDALVDAVHEFQGNDQQFDDISIVGISCKPLQHFDKKTGQAVDVSANYHAADCFPWSLTIKLRADELKRTDIVAQTVAFLGAIQGVELHQQKIFTIVSELYNNALEHGVLRLSSDLKSSPEGFEKYYSLREQRLEDLSEQSIEVKLEYLRGQPNRVGIEITDSGDGFDITEVQSRLDKDDATHGRGLRLLASLCSELRYSNQGRTVTAYYEFI